MKQENTSFQFKPFYPDVLGAITHAPRINLDVLECAVGIHPRLAYLNQPIEVVIVLQSMIDQEIQLKIAVRMPTSDPKGRVVIIETDKPMISVNLRPGEVGVLRLPIVARPPTPAGKDFPVRVAIRYRAPSGQLVRPIGGGAPPSVLSISPFKLQVLREVEFAAQKWNESVENVTVFFDLAPKNIQVDAGDIKVRYESLWTKEEMSEEIRLARKYYEDALHLAKPAATSGLYVSFMDAVEERFAARGMPLHPGETMAIAKMLSYTVEDAPSREPDVVLENTRWFRSLCQVLAHDPALLDIDRNDLISKYVFEGVMFEAILLAFKILKLHVKENLGNLHEQINYANRLMKWLAGHGESDLTYVYLPLVLAGVTVARIVRHSFSENPWDIYDELLEASKGRIRLVSGESVVVFHMLDQLLDAYQLKLKAQRIERPDRK